MWKNSYLVYYFLYICGTRNAYDNNSGQPVEASRYVDRGYEGLFLVVPEGATRFSINAATQLRFAGLDITTS